LIDKKPLIIFGIAALVILTFFIYFRGNKAKYDWDETYEESNKEPYGTFIVHELLKSYRTEGQFFEITESLYEDLKVDEDSTASYVFVGEALYLDTLDVNTLLRFVEKGNTAFIASKTIPYDLMFYVYYTECNNYYWDDYKFVVDTMSRLNMLHPDLKTPMGFLYKFMERSEAQSYNWQYIDSIYFCDQPESFVALGGLNDSLINFAKIPYGKGFFYMHTTPLAFTNFQMIDESGLDYANRIFTHLGEGPVYWDNYSQVPEEIGRRRNEASGGGNRHVSKEGPLSYILSQAPLAWAWYTALATALLYFLFGAKREQRIIPVLEENRNTSLDFISTIGSLYFQQNDHRKLCLQKMKLFLSYLRERYHMNTTTLDEDFFKRLSAKSEIPPATIEKIFFIHKNISDSSFTSEQTLIDFHLEMDKFYKHCK
jgi:hypothetical protein